MLDFKARMHQIRFQLGLRPRPHWRQRSSRPLAVFKGPILLKGGKGRGGDEKVWGRERMGKGRGEEGEGERGEERGRETKGFISRILLFEPWQLCCSDAA